jgi:hypothetical protein
VIVAPARVIDELTYDFAAAGTVDSPRAPSHRHRPSRAGRCSHRSHDGRPRRVEEVIVALRIRFLGPTGSTLGFSIERLSDGSIYDFSTSQFTSGTPTTPQQSLPENTPGFPGQYKATLSSTPVSQFTNGDYSITVVDQQANLCIGVAHTVMSNGDDTTVISGGPVASVVAPVTVGTNNDKSGYALSQAFPSNFANLTIDGTGRVTAGSVADKSGYALAAAGLDAIPIEAGINARQALAPILAAAAGVVTGAGTGTIVIQGANGNASRIVATTDNAGNRLSVVLALPS